MGVTHTSQVSHKSVTNNGGGIQPRSSQHDLSITLDSGGGQVKMASLGALARGWRSAARLGRPTGEFKWMPSQHRRLAPALHATPALP